MNATVVRFELVSYAISHTTSEGTEITTKALKIRRDYDQRQELFTSLLSYFQKGNKDERLTRMSNTAEWKLIPFANNTLSRDQMKALVKKQNKYLYDVYAISYVNLGSLEGFFCSGSDVQRIEEEDSRLLARARGDSGLGDGG